MQRPSIAGSVYKLAIAGERAGFSLEDMIQILNAGATVETLLNLIEWRLGEEAPVPRSSRWIV
jgi:lipid-binding SYLF domain-containing protein